jgi:hypothetical protein
LPAYRINRLASATSSASGGGTEFEHLTTIAVLPVWNPGGQASVSNGNAQAGN